MDYEHFQSQEGSGTDLSLCLEHSPALSILFYQQVLSHHDTDQTGCSQISLTLSFLN